MTNISIVKNEARTKLYLENIKCGGCGKTIEKSLSTFGLKNISVSPEENTVEFDTAQSEEKIPAVLEKLKSLGYPLVDSEEGLKALTLKAKSYISCAIGKMSK
jgi:copper chaperone